MIEVATSSAAATEGREAGEATGVDALLEGLAQEGFLQTEGRMVG